MNLVNAQVISNTFRTFVSLFAKPYNKYGRWVQKLLRSQKQSASYAAAYLKKNSKRVQNAFVHTLRTEFNLNRRTVY
jgi:hypothetical protein